MRTTPLFAVARVRLRLYASQRECSLPLPKTMYAPEVWGIGTTRSDTLLAKIQVKITHLAKAAIRPGGRNPHAQVAIREMGLKPVADIDRKSVV